jgi:hypothetical protein
MTHAPAGEHGEEVILTHCANCGRRLEGRYCAECGQKAAELNPTLHEFLHDFTHELLHVDGKIFRSVQFLLTQPGLLTREYFEGRRSRYITPIRLYLIFSVLFFAVSAIGSSMNVNMNITAADRAEMSEAPAWLQRGADADPRQVAARVVLWAPRAMFVLVPVFGLIVSAVTRSAGRNYPQDLYFALHTHAAVFGFLGLAALLETAQNAFLEGVVELLGIVYVPWYLIVALRTAYGGSWRRAFGRAALIVPLYGMSIVAAITAATLIAIFVSSGRTS